jgi:hypothetical protein
LFISFDISPIAQIKMSKKTNTKPIPENIRLIPSPKSSAEVISRILIFNMGFLFYPSHFHKTVIEIIN